MWKEYKTKNDREGKVNHWKLCKILKFDHIAKWYMHKPEIVQENDIHKTLSDFEIQKDHQIQARRSDLVLL